MNKHLSTAFLALALLQGCIINGGNNSGLRDGDVTFLWRFMGDTCDEVPVAAVRVTIPGEQLEDGGYYGCLNGGVPGITLHDFFGGNYEYTLEGLSNTGEVLYRASGTFAINGDVTLNVDLTPSGEASSYALLSWSFPSNWASQTPSCADATVTYIDVEIDNSGVWDRYHCADGMGGGEASTRLIAPGTHTIDLVAVHVSGENEYAVAYQGSTFVTVSNAPASHSFTLDWEIGGTTVAWELEDGGADETCTQAKVETVYVHFRDVETGELVDFGQGENTGDDNVCTASTVTYRYLYAGTYDVYLSATNADGVSYLSPSENPPRITVTAGTWTPDSPAVVTLHAERQ